MSEKPPAQRGLFDDGPEEHRSALVNVSPVAGPLSAAQKNFNRLTERIRRGRKTLASWEAFMPRFRARFVAEVEPVLGKIAGVERLIVQQLHVLLAAKGKGERLSPRRVEKARLHLLETIESLLEREPDAELESLYDRYGDIPLAEQRKLEIEMAEEMFGEILGHDVMKGHNARNFDDVAQHAAEKIAAGEARLRNASSARSGREGKRAKRAAERKAEAQREASLSVREIYRKLASALHPDREADAAERERKTGLLQRANQAYERNDLLELLTLQIETEQIDLNTLSNAPEERLRRYNQVLLDQATALDAQTGELTGAFRVELNLTMRDVTPERVAQALSEHLRDMQILLSNRERDLARLGDRQQRLAVIDALPDPDEAFDLGDIALLGAMLGEAPGLRRRSARGRKPRKRRRR